MQKTIGRLALLIACLAYPGIGEADVAGGCNPTAENARYQLDKASGNAALALKDWLHYCPNDDLMMRYAQAIEKAKGTAANKTPAPVKVSPPPPPPRLKAEPYGTFAQSSRITHEDHSGYTDRDDTLTMREDGTAHLRSRFKVNLDTDWHLDGCGDNVRQGVKIVAWKLTTETTDRTVTLRIDGKPELISLEPSCWETDAPEDDPDYVWTLDWIDGRLKDGPNELFRQD